MRIWILKKNCCKKWHLWNQVNMFTSFSRLLLAFVLIIIIKMENIEAVSWCAVLSSNVALRWENKSKKTVNLQRKNLMPRFMLMRLMQRCANSSWFHHMSFGCSMLLATLLSWILCCLCVSMKSLEVLVVIKCALFTPHKISSI